MTTGDEKESGWLEDKDDHKLNGPFFRRMRDLTRTNDVLKKLSVKTKPSFPNPTDDQKPTDPNLWEQILEVAEGKRLELRRGERTIHAPNDGRGFRNMPNNPKGIAWAVKQYNAYEGHWKTAKDKSKDQIPGGLADKGPPKDLDPKQLEMGIKVEMEHTDDKSIAREIALDHLTEDPKYYDKLKTIEKHAWDQRLIRMAAGGVEVTQGADTQHAQKLASQGILELAGTHDDRHYWDITARGVKLALAGLQQEFERHLQEVQQRKKAYPPGGFDEGVFLTEEDKDYLRDFAAWFRRTFRVDTAKTPRGQGRTKEDGQRLLRLLDTYSTPGGKTSATVLDTIVEIGEGLDLQALVRFFSEEGDTGRGTTVQQTEIKGSQAVYYNRANISNANFEKYAARLDQMLAKLKGWHRKALQGTPKVVFVGRQQMTVQGKYKETAKELWVRATPQVMKRGGGGYASPEYIIVHELGHRYEDFNRLPTDFDREGWRTTKYSFNDGEAFAELFAISHFGLTGQWDPETVKRFERVMTGKEKVAALETTPNPERPTLSWVD